MYGHPHHKVFDSSIQFYPHWRFLLNHGSGETCKCKLCDPNATKSKPHSRGSSSIPTGVARIRIPPPLKKGPVDEEGTPDVYRSLFTLLKNEGKLKRKIEERSSLVCFTEFFESFILSNMYPCYRIGVPRNPLSIKSHPLSESNLHFYHVKAR